MSAGAFTLICNDGKADRLIMATKLLNQRIKDVMCARKAKGKPDIMPTLADIERTHHLFVNDHFKPFAAIGSEYNKVRAQSGSTTFGSGVTFSIPQFGDFFHDMVCRTRVGRFHALVQQTPLQGSAMFPSPAVISGNNTYYNIVDAFGNRLITGSSVIGGSSTAQISYRNFVRYCEFPGLRLFRLVKFDVNGNPLDQYDTMVPVMLEKFCTAPNKRQGHDRLVGQEVPLQGYGPLRAAVVTDADAANTPAGILRDSAAQSNQGPAVFGSQALPVIAAGTAPANVTNFATVVQGGAAPVISSLNSSAIIGAQYDVSRELKKFVNGPQTPKPAQPALEMWHKFRFWFNEDVRRSVPSVSIPFGQRFVSAELNTPAELCYEYPSIFLEKVVDPGAAGTFTRVKTYTPIFQSAGILEPVIEKMELYINNIFVNSEIHDIFIRRVGFSLIRVYRQHTQRVNQESSDEKLLSQLKWPIELMMIGLRPTWNIKNPTTGAGGVVNGGNLNAWRDWHRLTRQVDADVVDPDLAETVAGAAPPSMGGSSIAPVIPDKYWLPVPTVDSLSLTAHGITLFDGFTDMFHNAYLPFHYGGPAINTPDDHGALLINMAFFPRSQQPSGHLNVSRARETYLKFTTSYVSSKTPADLIVVAIAINFLLITDGSAILRYST